MLVSKFICSMKLITLCFHVKYVIGFNLPAVSNLRLSSPTVCNLAVDLVSTLGVALAAKAKIAFANCPKSVGMACC